MKKILSIIIFIIFGVILAQKPDNTSKFYTEIKILAVSGIGNKYFKNSFNASPAIDVAFSYKFLKRFGAFINCRNVFLSIKNPEVYGNFDSINMLNYNFGGYYSYPLNKKMNLEAKAFLGGFEINGNITGVKSKYRQTGFTYGLGTNVTYHADKKGIIDLIGGIEYQNLNSNIHIDNSFYENYYKHSSLLIPNFGIRFNF